LAPGDVRFQAANPYLLPRLIPEGDIMHSSLCWFVLTMAVAVPAMATPLPARPQVTVSADIKQIKLSWPAALNAAYYLVLESPDGVAPYVPISSRIAQLGPLASQQFTKKVSVHRTDWLNEYYKVQACNATGCSYSREHSITAQELAAIGYVKASNTDDGDAFGYSLALSSDGKTLAVGAMFEDCSCAGVNPAVLDENAPEAGAVYVFYKQGNRWQQQAYLKPAAPVSVDYFGSSVALSATGDTLVVGAQNRDVGSGSVMVFARAAGVWTQVTELQADNADLSDRFGQAVAVNGTGDTIAVGAPGEASDERGVGGSGTNDNAARSGAAYVFTFDGTAWLQSAYLKGIYSDGDDWFGNTLSLSADGATLAVGSPFDDSFANGTPNAYCPLVGAPPAGAVCEAGSVDVYVRDANGTWSHGAHLIADVRDAGDYFGYSVALSGDGLYLAAGAYTEDSATTGVNGNAADNSAGQSGAAYVFARSGDVWTQEAYIKASATDASDYFGKGVALDEDGGTLLVSAPREDGSGAGTQAAVDNLAVDAGAVFLFERDATTGTWSQQRYLKAQNPDAGDHFGGSALTAAVAVSADAATIAVPAGDEDGSGVGVPGTPQDEAAASAGAVYLY
jgi:hypothetical protein